MDEYNQDGEKLDLKNVHNDEITFTYDFDMFDTIRNQAGWTVLIEKVKEMLDTDKIDKIIYDFVVEFNKVNSTPQYKYITENKLTKEEVYKLYSEQKFTDDFLKVNYFPYTDDHPSAFIYFKRFREFLKSQSNVFKNILANWNQFCFTNMYVIHTIVESCKDKNQMMYEDGMDFFLQVMSCKLDYVDVRPTVSVIRPTPNKPNGMVMAVERLYYPKCDFCPHVFEVELHQCFNVCTQNIIEMQRILNELNWDNSLGNAQNIHAMQLFIGRRIELTKENFSKNLMEKIINNRSLLIDNMFFITIGELTQEAANMEMKMNSILNNTNMFSYIQTLADEFISLNFNLMTIPLKYSFENYNQTAAEDKKIFLPEGTYMKSNIKLKF
tara:strand:+ start:140 stop:1285 length:1146 start_codon:yes stop_codon:yes gene_type:complete